MRPRAITGTVMLYLLAFTAPASAGVVRSLTDLHRPAVGRGALNDQGTSVWAISAADPLGTNPGRVPQIFRWDPATSSVAQVTFFEDGVVEPPGSSIVTPAVIPGVSVTENGQWIAFLSRGNLTGNNPDRNVELYLMRTDGSILRQLTATDDPGATIFRFAISGFGTRLVFLHDGELTVPNPDRAVLAYKIEADGTGLRRLTSSTPDRGASWVSISDDGTRAALCESVSPYYLEVFAVDVVPGTVRQLTNLSSACRIAEVAGFGNKIAFETAATGIAAGPVGNTACQGHSQIAITPWAGNAVLEVSGSCDCTGAARPGWAYGPTLTDDGTWVFYGEGAPACPRNNIYKSRTDGGERVPLAWPSAADASCTWAVAPGAAGEVSFLCDGETLWASGQNSDGGTEIHSVSQSAPHPIQDPQQISASIRSGNSHVHDLTPDGTRVLVSSDAQPDGAPPSPAEQLYLLDTTGGGPVAVTSFDRGEIAWAGLTDDAQTIAFLSTADPFAPGTLSEPSLYAIAADGTGVRRLTPATYRIDVADVAGDGSVAIFSTTAALPDGGSGVYRVLLDGTGRTKLAERARLVAVDATGTWATSRDILNGGILRMRVDGSSPPERVTPVTYQNDVERLAISGDGSRIVFSAYGNLNALNPEGNWEIYVWEAATNSVRALTATVKGFYREFGLSRDGTHVVAIGSEDHMESGRLTDIVRIDVATGATERIDGLRPSQAERLAIDLTGDRVAFSGTGRASGANSDWSGEIFLIDTLATPGLTVSPGPGPTTITWDVESGPTIYDVIRGDVAGLSLTEHGAVDLGAVSCVENNSPDATTRGNEDLAAPAPGQAWFYLLRGATDSLDPPAPYGTGSSGGDRIPASGDCPSAARTADPRS